MEAWQVGEGGRLEERAVAEWKNNHGDILNYNTDYKSLPMKMWPICKN